MTDDGHTTTNDDQIAIDSSVLFDHKEELDHLFRMYIEDINPFIVRFETAKTEFPIEIQNEIRAIYGHLVRASMSTDKKLVSENIEKMHAHSKRALRDCFKYNSIVLSDKYDEFMSRYEGIDLTYIEEGEFLPRVVSKCEAAKKKLQNAKINETTNLTEDEKYNLYQEAYIAFEDVVSELEAAESNATFLKRRVTQTNAMNKRAYYIGIAGVVVGVLGCIIGLLV